MTAISDHAIVRYLERVKGIDMDRIRAEMASPAAEVATRIGCGTVIGRSGERLVIENGVIVTVLAKRFGRKDRRMSQ